ncbi:ABC transporter related protein [Gordonia neofelifaecis NRRL B-59395]|uniref:ABC transporter related protein n=1 Tax=Gordonia neofelifaecis NRRL B-59395 TaxID=644548 RepID=F1YKP1_9ACTN|nr:ABC transporter related protein [Gordonia neofelifaecis NRRL B-59395]
MDLKGLTKTYGTGTTAVAALGPIDLTVAPGEFLVLVGASGCGKSTLLRLVGGLDSPTAGTVSIAGDAAVPGRNVGVVFQQPRLLPWRTVGGNVELALRYAGVPRAERRDRAADLLDRVGLPDVARRRVWEISGGQQQRVAIARALAAPTPVLLMDEPFAALDALTRERLQDDVRQVGAESGRTTVFVTHSPDEAAVLGTRIVVLSRHPGRIAADLASPLSRDADGAELRETADYVGFRAEIAAAVRAAAA